MYIKTQKANVYYEKTEKKQKDIIILPGWGDTRKTFNYIINNFKNDFRIFILDYPGFGKSNDPTEELTLNDYAEIIIKLIKKEKIKNPIIIAHSFGGRISSLLISHYKIEIDKLILIDVAGIKRNKIKRYLKTKLYKVLKQLIKLTPKKINKFLSNKLQKSFSSKDYKDLSLVMKKTFNNIIKENLLKYYKLIQTETLIIWGEKDLDTPLKDGYLLNKVIKNSALIIYKNSTHYSYLENIYLTNKILEKLIKKED